MKMSFLNIFRFYKNFFFLDNVIVRENIKGMFSLFYHLANIIRNITFECSLNVLKQLVQLKKEIHAYLNPSS